MDFLKILHKIKQFGSSNALLVGTVAGAAAGFLFGLFLKTFPKNEAVTSLVSYPGELFMRALQLLIIPVIVFSLIAGSGSLNIKTNGKIALRTFVYFLSTSLFNAAFGTLLAILVEPGDSTIKSSLEDVRLATIDERKNTLLDNFLDLGRNVIPNNVFTSFFEMTTTIYTINDENEYEKRLGSRKGVNAIGLIFYSLMFGTVMSLLDEKAKPLRDVVRAVDEVNTKTISGLIWLTPFGVASLICAKVLEVDNMGKIMSSLTIFILTVLFGILVYQLILMQLLYFVFLRRNPFKFYTGVLPAALTGFAADSSSAALPVTLKCLDEQKVDSRVAHFVVPIGVICNMDGTALFISISSIFIAQMNNIELALSDYIMVCVTSTAVSIAAASAPSASLTLMPLVLNAIGAPVQDIGLLFAIDWLCDRIRTTNNVLGDCYASAIVAHWSQKELQEPEIPLKIEAEKPAEDIEMKDV